MSWSAAGAELNVTEGGSGRDRFSHRIIPLHERKTAFPIREYWGQEVRRLEQSANGQSIVLPEEAPPPSARPCDRCGLCGQGTRMVWGEGNPRARIMMILDNPGAREDREGREYVCGTRETLQRGMREAGMPADSVYVTYLLKRRPIRAYDKPAARAACLTHLQDQLRQKKPMLLMGFGNVVAEALLPEAEAGVKELRGAWQEFEGIPIRFTYHPLAVRRRPNLTPNFTEDLRAFAARWREEACQEESL